MNDTEKYYCKYCGKSFINADLLTQSLCCNNPKGKYHVVYIGGKKSKYYCQYCGAEYLGISSLTKGLCHKNPDGKYHVPYEGKEN